jgi:hypothetical protein
MVLAAGHFVPAWFDRRLKGPYRSSGKFGVKPGP